MKFLKGISVAVCLSVTSIASADNKSLFAAIDSKDSAAVKEAIKQGADVNATRYSSSALEWTVIEKDLESTKVLVEAGASYDAMNKLMVQATGQPEFLSYFIELGADPNMNVMGMSLLEHAVSENCIACVKTLVSSGADTKKLDKKGKNILFKVPIGISKRNDGVAMTDLLLSYGLDINHNDNDGLTPLAQAVKERKVKYVDHLISLGADRNSLDKEGRPIAYYAWTSNYPQSYASSFPLKDLSDKDQSSVMEHHLKQGNEDVVAYLLESGVAISQPETWLKAKVGRSVAIMYLIMGHYPEINLDEAFVEVSHEEKPIYARALVRHGAKANKLDGYQVMTMIQSGLEKELYAAGVTKDYLVHSADEYSDGQTLEQWAKEHGFDESLSVWDQSLDTLKEKEYLNIKIGTSETEQIKELLQGSWKEESGDLTWSFDEDGRAVRTLSFFGMTKEAKGKWSLSNSAIDVIWDEDERKTSFAIADFKGDQLMIEGRGDTKVYLKQ